MNCDLNCARLKLLRLVGVVLVSLAAGCSSGGKDLGRVQGVIRLDGAPLSGASVVFEPKNGSPSMAHADEDGEYELRFSRDLMGAAIGEHRVKVSTAEDQDGRRTKERVPSRYNVKTELTANVQAGQNSIDFDLKSGGPVVQPRD